MVTMDKDKIDWKDVLLVLVPAVMAYFIRTAIKSSQHYYMNIDSYYYLSRISDGVVGNEFLIDFGNVIGPYWLEIFLATVSIWTVVLLYFVLRIDFSWKTSFFTTILFAISPMVFFNNQFGIIDKNPLALFMIILIMGLMRIRIPEYYRFGVLVLMLFTFMYIWAGAAAMIVLLLFYVLILFIKEKNMPGIAMGIGGILLMIWLGYGSIQTLLSSSTHGLVSELMPIWNVGLWFGDYFVIIMIYLFIIMAHKKKKIDFKPYTFEVLGFFIFLIATIFVFRLHVYLLPFAYYLLAVFFENIKVEKEVMKHWSLICLAAALMLTSLPVYARQPIMNDVLLEAISYINDQDTDCIIGVWDSGHMYDYYSPKQVLYSADSRYYKDQVNYLVYGNKTNCSIIYSDRDVRALQFMLISNGIRMNETDFWILQTNSTDVHFGSYHVKMEV
jgi:hypothetical protein